VAFRATLTDREVDEVADTLFEMGYDDIAFRPLATMPETCRCGRLIGTFDCPFCGDGFNARRAAHQSRADTTRDRDALRDALQHETQRGLKW
jgi:hypothetical protein